MLKAIYDKADLKVLEYACMHMMDDILGRCSGHD